MIASAIVSVASTLAKFGVETKGAVAAYKAQKEQTALEKQAIKRQDDEDTDLYMLRAQDRMSEFLSRTGKVNSYAAVANIGGGASVMSLQQSAALATAVDQYVDTRAINTTRQTSQIKLAALDRELQTAKTQMKLSIAGSLFGAGANLVKQGAAAKAEYNANQKIKGSAPPKSGFTSIQDEIYLESVGG